MEEYDLPSNLFGGKTVWDRLIDEHGGGFVGISRTVMPNPEGRTEIVYRYAVAMEFVNTQREPGYEGVGEGLRSAEERRLDRAITRVAEEREVTSERVRQAYAQPYSGSSKKKQFLDDLIELEEKLTECDG